MSLLSLHAFRPAKPSPRFGDYVHPLASLGQTAPPSGSVYGIQNHGVQRYLPIGERRELDQAESLEVRRGLSRWWPALFSNYSTPIADLLANPTKSAMISGLGGALLTGLMALGTVGVGPLALAGMVIGGVIGAISGYAARQQENGNILDLLRRLPAGSTKRDLLSDPVYQSDLDRRAVASSFTNSYNRALMVNSLLSLAHDYSLKRSSTGGFSAFNTLTSAHKTGN